MRILLWYTDVESFENTKKKKKEREQEIICLVVVLTDGMALMTR